jgi:nitrogen fixation protein NifU and related proteins
MQEAIPMSDQKLYHDLLLDHYKYPHNKGLLANSDYQATIFNPLCGDQVTMQAMIDKGIIKSCHFDGKGCVISLAAASLLTKAVEGMTTYDVLRLQKDFMLNLVKLELGPTRLRCALLALEALQKGMVDVASSKVVK